MTSEVRVVAVLQALPGSGAEVLALWPSLSAQVRAEEGCLAYALHRVAGDGDRFVVLERWASLATLAAHGQSPHMQEFGSRASGLLSAAPEIIVLEDVPAA